MYLADIYTSAVNLAGLPGISIPAGFQNKLPIGMQLIGKHFSESHLLNIAHLFQTETDWHTKTPEGF
jgi:aspartyl-tRNA(Asn)/glutamyl-tRNA(Gln) amidotransferase subunit A